MRRLIDSSRPNFSRTLIAISMGLSSAFALANATPRSPQLARVIDALNDTYQIGTEWGKQVVTAESMAENAVLNSIAMSTARVRGGGTGFYLGKHNGQYLMGTNFHVCEESSDCVNRTAEFSMAGFTVNIKGFLGSWNNVDFALITLDLTNSQAEALEPYVNHLGLNASLEKGLELMTAGFGIANNPRRQLVVNMDSDCKVYSDTDSFRLMADPDELNPGPYKAWSFANGCDISHGDSGSAMINRATGEVVGIIWTGRIPKNKEVRNQTYLDSLYDDGLDGVWTQLSYAVPMPKIAEQLQSVVADEENEENVRETVAALLEANQ